MLQMLMLTLLNDSGNSCTPQVEMKAVVNLSKKRKKKALHTEHHHTIAGGSSAAAAAAAAATTISDLHHTASTCSG